MGYMKTLDEIIDTYRVKVELDEEMPCPDDCCGCSCHISPLCYHCLEMHGFTYREILDL